MADQNFGKKKRSLRNLLLDRRFQLKYASVIALTGGVIFAVMGWLFFDKVRENSQLAAIDDMAAAAPPASAPSVKIEREPMVPPDAPATAADADFSFQQALMERLEKEDDPILWRLAAFWLILVAALFVVGILATHRIVGPIYVVDMYVRKIMAGEPVRPRALRRGDEFQALFLRVNEMAHRLRDERTHDIAVLETCMQRLRARLDTIGDGQVGARDLAHWLEEDLSGVRDLADGKRRYIGEGDAGAN